MNYALVFSLVGVVLKFELAFMTLPLIVSLMYGGGDTLAFVYSMSVLAVVSLLLSRIKVKEKKLRPRDGIMTAVAAWVLISGFGALPFYLSGYFNTLADCIFEAVSGFTTTGATVLSYLEDMPRGLMLWRCFAHWIGGMGVLVFLLAVMPSMSASSINLLRVELSGMTHEKMRPKLRETAKILYLIYLSMSVVVVVCLMLAGMNLYDALVHAMSVAGTGGFSSRTLSIAAYNSPVIEYIISVFLFLFGVNYTLYYYLVRKEFKLAFLDEELLLYIIVVALASGIIAVDIAPVYGSADTALRYSVFQVSSVITTAGFSSVNYNLWPAVSKLVLLFVMLTGCCAGSTGGGIKLVRLLLLLKYARLELARLMQPNVVRSVIINNKAVDTKIINRMFLYFFTYFLVMVVALLIVALDGFDLVTTATAVLGALSNTGPGFGLVGPIGNYGGFSSLSKLVLSVCMIAGRLEMFPVLIILAPAAWRRG